MFNEAQEEVYELMKNNAYKEFLQSMHLVGLRTPMVTRCRCDACVFLS